MGSHASLERRAHGSTVLAHASWRVIVGLLLMGLRAGAQTGEPPKAAASANPADGNGPALEDIFAGFQATNPVPMRPLDDLIRHFETSDVPCRFVKHAMNDDLRRWQILEQAHSTTGRYSFTINRLPDKIAARASYQDLRQWKHEGGINGVFTLCIHKGFEADKVLEVFRKFVPAPPPASTTNALPSPP